MGTNITFVCVQMLYALYPYLPGSWSLAEPGALQCWLP